MQKAWVSALTTALVIGATATTFAAANPFSDVPSDHWAYDAVVRLAADGIIEGYGDDNFRGDRNITRYEMAQMVAKAMVKADTSASATDRALIDNLAQEFAEELNSLGIRVARLEENKDKISFTGEMRYRYWRFDDDLAKAVGADSNTNKLQLRIYPDAEINENWRVKGELRGNIDAGADAPYDPAFSMRSIYAEGDYDNVVVKLGKLPLYSVADDGMVADAHFTGASVTFGKNETKFKVEAGRWNMKEDTSIGHAISQMKDDPLYEMLDANPTATYVGLEVDYEKDRFNGGIAFRSLSGGPIKNMAEYMIDKDQVEGSNAVVSLGLGYRFNDFVKLSGAYAKTVKGENFAESDKAWSLQLDYRGADYTQKGSWGAFLAYRSLGFQAALAPTYETIRDGANVKGVDLRISYVPFLNSLTEFGYFSGKSIQSEENAYADTGEGDSKSKSLYARLSYFF